MKVINTGGAGLISQRMLANAVEATFADGKLTLFEPGGDSGPAATSDAVAANIAVP